MIVVGKVNTHIMEMSTQNGQFQLFFAINLNLATF